MSHQVSKYSDDSGDVEEGFLGTSTDAQPSKRCFTWRVTLLLHWAVIGFLCLIILDHYPQIKEIDIEISKQIYCKLERLALN